MLSIIAMYNYDPTIFDDVQLPENLDKETLINTILLQNGELDLLYPQPKVLKAMIKTWSDSSQYSWNKLANILTLEYNPIWNKDGTITENETAEGSGSGVQKVAGFDSETFQNRGRDEAESSSTRTYTRTEQGNIGLTSTQELIRQEIEVSNFNVYDRISDDFKQKFCIQVY